MPSHTVTYSKWAKPHGGVEVGAFAKVSKGLWLILLLQDQSPSFGDAHLGVWDHAVESQSYDGALVESVWEDQPSPGGKGGTQGKGPEGKNSGFASRGLGWHGSTAGVGGASFPLFTVMDVS